MGGFDVASNESVGHLPLASHGTLAGHNAAHAFLGDVVQNTPLTTTSACDANECVRSNPEDWGPRTWNFLHCLAHKLPDKVPLDAQRNLQVFIKSLPDNLPCGACSSHLRDHMTVDPVDSHLGTRA